MHKFIENIAQVLVGIGIMYSISSIYEKRQQAQLLIAPYIAPLYDIYPLQNVEPIYHDYSTETEPVTEPLETTESPRVDNFEPPITNQSARVPQVTLLKFGSLLTTLKFIIIGVMKCGTSATSTFLRQHSQLFDMGKCFKF